MKRIILIPIIFLAFICNAQKICQNITSDLNGKIVCCVDTLEHEDYTCHIVKEIDSILVGLEYQKFILMCNDITNNKTKSYVIQLTSKQLFYMDNPPRIIIRWDEDEQRIVNYGELSEAGKTIYNEFINKIKTLL